ncbi:MAG: hypothetical protein ACRDRP_12425 [Pseudonocardiaceae bacterium]
MISSAALCPGAPLLARELTGLDPVVPALRESCAAAVSGMLRGMPDIVVVVGLASRTATWPATAQWSTSGFRGRAGPKDPDALPLALGLGAMLINDAGYQGPLVMQGVGEHEPVTKCIDIGTGIRDSSDRVGLLVMADGSCRRDAKAPGYFDERAISFDLEIERFIRSADLDALLGVDQETAHELMAQGRPAWQVLAGATRGQEYDAKILYSDAPFGVAYLVAFFLWRTPGGG